MALHLSLPKTGEGERGQFALTPEQFDEWLRDLPDEPLERSRQILARLTEMNRSRVRVTLRQDISEQIRVQLLALLPGLDSSLASGTLPLSVSSRSAAGIVEDLVTELAYSYKLLLVEQARRLFGLASSGRAVLPVVRAMQLLARRLTLGYRVYATNAKGVWLELHELYQFALRRGLANRSLPDEIDTPLSVYRDALLIAFAEPLKLMRGDLDRVAVWLARFGFLASVSSAGQTRAGQGVFLLKPQRDVPGYALAKRHHPVPHGRDMLLNTLPAAEALLDQLAKLAAGEDPATLGLPPESTDPAFRDLMGRLVKHWGAVPNRRFTRLRTHARVEISVGIRGIWDFLNRKPNAARAGEWMVTNESPRGFALLHVGGPIEQIRVGEVIGLRTRDSQTCHVCVVRWVLSDNPEHLELGLEELAPNARPVTLRTAGMPQPQESQPVLLLPEVPSLNQAPAILAPLFPLDASCELNLGELQSRLRVRATRLLERTVSIQIVQFSAVT
jgi:cyclic-di-GMP-binding protein